MRLHREIPPEEREKRKRYLTATLITCIAAAIIGGSLHVVKLGANRMQEMRAKASYDLSEEAQHIRAAGEDIRLHAAHEAGEVPVAYTAAEAAALLREEEWQRLDAMVTIPAGPFIMGTDLPRTDPQNRPAHRVTLPAYEIDKYPVTNAQYARFVAETGHRPPLHWHNGRIPTGLAKHPVTMVSWFDARDYCRWAGKRLPTEAEWEKAARGTDGRRWPWGNVMDPERLNTYYRIGHTTPVDRFPKGASPYGVMDMAGNVQEWVEDDFAPYPGSPAPADLFKAKKAVRAQDNLYNVAEFVVTGDRYKVMRGGSWKSDPFSTSTFHRNYALPNYASDFFGFRCARDVRAAEKKEDQ